MRLRRVRSAQAALLGSGSRDLVDFAVSLQGRIDGLHREVDEVAATFAGLGRLDLDRLAGRRRPLRRLRTRAHQSASVPCSTPAQRLVLSAIQDATTRGST
jgi:hypothetical protein